MSKAMWLCCCSPRTFALKGPSPTEGNFNNKKVWGWAGGRTLNMSQIVPLGPWRTPFVDGIFSSFLLRVLLPPPKIPCGNCLASLEKVGGCDYWKIQYDAFQWLSTSVLKVFYVAIKWPSTGSGSQSLFLEHCFGRAAFWDYHLNTWSKA